jgi:glycosyltransferase involved in cell wall biosynthesis
MKRLHKPPLISVIVAVKDAEGTLLRCIESIRRQTHENIEFIVMDGDSHDRTVDILRQNGDLISYWESKKDKGVYHAWNKALDHVNGEWICFLGADDFFWDANCLQRMRRFLDQSYPKVRIVYGRVNVISGTGEVLYTIGKPWTEIKKRFLQINCLPHPGLMHHRSVFDDFGKFEDSFIIAGDYELLLRELLTSEAHYVPLTMVGMQHGGLSTLADNSITGLLEMRKALQMHGVGFPGIYWLMGIAKAYAILALKKATRALGTSGKKTSS